MTATTKKEKKRRSLPLRKAGTSGGHITNLKQSILQTFDIYSYTSCEQNDGASGYSSLPASNLSTVSSYTFAQWCNSGNSTENGQPPDDRRHILWKKGKKFWNFEILKFWNFEILKFWNFEILKFWNFEILKFWNFEIWHRTLNMLTFVSIQKFAFSYKWQILLKS